MPCDMMFRREMLRVKLAEQGWNEDEIRQLELELELEIQKAKKKSYEDGDTLAQQKERMSFAEKEIRKKHHEMMHAKLDKMMQDIKEMGDAKAIPDEAKEHKKVVH